jgi:hypothetical protein
MRIQWLIAAAVLAAPSLALAEPLELVCNGEAVKAEVESTSGALRNSDGDTATAHMDRVSKVRSSQRFRFRFEDDGTGAVKVPGALVPSINAGGKDGWWPLIGVVMTDADIHGGFALNFINKPKFVIDRRTGDVDLKGAGLRFSGACERVTDAAEARKF